MARIFLVRHAESLANTQGIFQGQTHDTDLSPLGVRQAAALGRRFAQSRFDAILASPLQRTRQTAAALGQAVDEPSLTETNHGLWETRSKIFVQSRWPDLYAQWLTHPGTVEFPKGEPFSATRDRVVAWFDRLSATDQTVVAVTHSNVIMALLTHMLGQPLDAMWQYAMQPTAVTLIESHSPARVVYINDTSHLNGLESDLSTHAI